MSETVLGIIGIAAAVAIFLLIHHTAMKHIHDGSEKQTILSMEVVAFALLMGAFMGGEIFKMAAAVKTQQADIGLGSGDIEMVGVCLAGSLAIYVAVVRLLK
jgi:hypothetical protein